MSKHPAPRLQEEKRRGVLRSAAGTFSRDNVHRWCGLCGNLWADWDHKSIHRCCCSPDHLIEFLDQDAVKAAYAIGGDAAVHEIEKALWVERGKPWFERYEANGKR